MIGDGVDLLSSRVRDDPYPYYAHLRRDAPVHHFEAYGFWTVSRFDDVTSVLKRPNLFSSSGIASFESTLLGSDPPAHTRIRARVSALFSTHGITALEGTIRSVAERLCDAFVTGGRCELIAELAGPLPLEMMARLLGTDPGRSEDFRRWSNAVVVGAGAAADAEQQDQAERDLQAFHRFFAEHVDRCRMTPTRGPLGGLFEGEDGQEGLSPDEAADVAKLLMVAGNETTTNLIGNAVLALLQNPREMALVRAEPPLIPGLLEEVLRYDAPVQMVRRVTTRKTELGGVAIPSGAVVMALIGSANRDPDHFEDPDRFLIRRNPRDHLAFGIGPHFCVGAHLARLEARIALETLFSRVRKIRPTHPLTRIDRRASLHVRGPERLGLTFEAD